MKFRVLKSPIMVAENLFKGTYTYFSISNPNLQWSDPARPGPAAQSTNQWGARVCAAAQSLMCSEANPPIRIANLKQPIPLHPKLRAHIAIQVLVNPLLQRNSLKFARVCLSLVLSSESPQKHLKFVPPSVGWQIGYIKNLYLSATAVIASNSYPR